jgi:hypothetical protein
VMLAMTNLQRCFLYGILPGSDKIIRVLHGALETREFACWTVFSI